MKLISIAALSILSLFSGASIVHAEVSAENRAEAEASFEAFAELAAQLPNEPPRWSNPSHAEILARFWDSSATIGDAPYTEADLPYLIGRYTQANMVLKSYTFFTVDSEKRPDIMENVLKYEDEISHALAYNFDVMAAQFEAMSDFIAKLPAAEMNEARRDGLRMVQIGGVRTVGGIFQTIQDPELRPVNRSILLQALAENADIFASTMSPSSKKDIMVIFKPALSDLSGPDLEKANFFKAMLELGECNILCETAQE